MIVNNLKYTKVGKEFYLEAEFADIIHEYMSSILFIESNEESPNQINMKPLKSKYDEPDYRINIDKENLVII